jgi:hypothetical protein
MRKKGSIYKYIAVYIDYLAIAMKKPKEFTDILESKHKFKRKVTGLIAFHLGMDFTRDDDNTLCILPTKYIEKLIKNYEKLFGMKPSQNVTSPLDRGDHPEPRTNLSVPVHDWFTTVDSYHREIRRTYCGNDYV